MRSSSISMLSVVAIIGVLPLLAACGDHAASATVKPKRPVQVQRVALENEIARREFVGVVRARYETDLGFRVAGKIVSRDVNVGDRVQIGDVVARLDPQDLKLQVESAEAEFAAATSSLQQAASDLERYTTLKTQGWVSVADFDRKKAAKDEAEGRLERAKRSLDLAHNQLDYADLKADADGVITAVLAESGQVVANGQPVVRLAHRGEKEAVVALPETWLSEVQSSKATVQLWSEPGRNFPARLRELSPQADAATRTYAARFTIDNSDDSVALGMTATVTLSHSADVAVVKLPLAAILNHGTGPFVYVVDSSGALELRPVKVAAYTENTALVTSGVSAGDRIVKLGVQKLAAGERVRAVGER
jgi:RND family efflux transporter MFP subunit